jgi:hypothetical protein
LILEKKGIPLNNKKILLNNIKKEGSILTWIYPNWKLLTTNPSLCFRLLTEKRAIQNTIQSGMLHLSDSEIGVAINALMYLGENKNTEKAIAHCIATWEKQNDAHHFYEHNIVVAHHFARAYKEGITSFKKVSKSIEELLIKEKDSYCFAELVLAFLCLDSFNSNDLLKNEIKNQIIKKCDSDETIFEHYPYFTSKDRNYYAGSYCLTASWFLEASQNWIHE